MLTRVLNKLGFVSAIVMLVTMALSACSTAESAAEGTPARLSKEQQKRIKQVNDSIANIRAAQALDSLDFVLEADRLVVYGGQTVYVSPSTNFVSLDGDQAIIQVAPYNSGGPNGVGGVTLKGRAYNIDRKTDKKGNIYFSMSVMGAGLTATVDIQLYVGANRASLTINPMFNSRRITLSGVLLPSESSRIFVGQSIF